MRGHILKRKKIITISVLILSAVVVTAGLVLVRLKSDRDTASETPQASQENSQLTADDFVAVEVPAEANQTERTLVFTINTKDVNAMQLSAIDEYDSHAGPESVKDEDTHTLTITEAGKDVYKTSFTVSVSRTEEFADDGTIRMLEMSHTEKITLATPRFANGSEITIRNKAGKIVLKDTIEDVKTHKNKSSSYKTIVPKAEEPQAIEQREARH